MEQFELDRILKENPDVTVQVSPTVKKAQDGAVEGKGRAKGANASDSAPGGRNIGPWKAFEREVIKRKEKIMRIGIDPGISGALALLEDDLTLFGLADMPVMSGTGKRQQVNAAELAKIIKGGLGRICLTAPVIAYLEQVSAMPGQGVSSMFSFGMSNGIILGVLAALQVPVAMVRPAAWKKRAGLVGKEKDAARTLAQQLYPAAELGRKKDVGRAEAILIARFGDNETSRVH